MIINAEFVIKKRKEMGLTQKEFSKLVGTTEKTIQNWEAGRKIPDSKHGILLALENQNQPITQDTPYYIPLLPISAQGVSLNDFLVSVKDSDCEMVVSPIKGAEFAINVSGDSMAPEYPSGSQVLIKKINEKAFIDWGRVYVLDTCNGTVIKRLYPAEKPGVVVCKSINPDYPPFEVDMKDVFGVYRVLLCMSVK